MLQLQYKKYLQLVCISIFIWRLRNSTTMWTAATLQYVHTEAQVLAMTGQTNAGFVYPSPRRRN